MSKKPINKTRRGLLRGALGVAARTAFPGMASILPTAAFSDAIKAVATTGGVIADSTMVTALNFVFGPSESKLSIKQPQPEVIYDKGVWAPINLGSKEDELAYEAIIRSPADARRILKWISDKNAEERGYINTGELKRQLTDFVGDSYPETLFGLLHLYFTGQYLKDVICQRMNDADAPATLKEFQGRDISDDAMLKAVIAQLQDMFDLLADIDRCFASSTTTEDPYYFFSFNDIIDNIVEQAFLDDDISYDEDGNEPSHHFARSLSFEQKIYIFIEVLYADDFNHGILVEPLDMFNIPDRMKTYIHGLRGTKAKKNLALPFQLGPEGDLKRERLVSAVKAFVANCSYERNLQDLAIEECAKVAQENAARAGGGMAIPIASPITTLQGSIAAISPTITEEKVIVTPAAVPAALTYTPPETFEFGVDRPHSDAVAEPVKAPAP